MKEYLKQHGLFYGVISLYEVIFFYFSLYVVIFFYFSLYEVILVISFD
tara:strand:+ start:615 stop:758 length:144 start_codon:yes stop_codon:yes gene_type:complete